MMLPQLTTTRLVHKIFLNNTDAEVRSLMRAELSSGGERSLRNFLGELVWRHFFEDVRLEEPQLATYVVKLLTDFACTENLYRMRNASGKYLEDIGEMLIESNPLLGAASFDREREVRKHVGDYALFMTGLFPENVAGSRQNRRYRLDAFVDYVQAGKESYAVVSSFDQFEYREEAPMFRRLSENFEICVVGLNLVKQDLENFRQESYQRLKHSVDES
jgi:hypothetical protein